MHGPIGALENTCIVDFQKQEPFPKDMCVLYKMVNFNNFLGHSESKSFLKIQDRRSPIP